MQQLDARKPIGVAPVQPSTNTHRWNSRDVAAVGESCSHHIELILDPKEATANWQGIPLALELAATENRIGLRIDRLVEVACVGTADCRVRIAGVARQPSKDEALESRVIG